MLELFEQVLHVILKIIGKLGVSVSYDTLPIGNDVRRRAHDTFGNISYPEIPIYLSPLLKRI
jgi:hypothetical protein